jgi:AcrR family transcriptional regulator
MPNKTGATTKARLAESAWKLFYEKGYDNTTIEDIVDDSGTSKGSFYHYFDGKDALLSTLSDLFDEKYEALQETMDPEMPAMDQLLFLNSQLFRTIENSVSLELLARLLSTQLVTAGSKHLLDHRRTYYRLLRKIISRGQERGELSGRQNVSEMVKLYALCERALLYDWCLCGGEYSLHDYAVKVLPGFLSSFLP